MAQTTLPDYHFLYIAPNLGAEWFFDAARAYWERYRPIVIADFEFLRFIPENASIAVTALARRDIVAEVGVQLAQIRPDALFDPISEDLFEDMRETLTMRAELTRPFGVALDVRPTPDSRINPTPGAVGGPTRLPGGFITQTPTPTQPPMPTQPAEQTPLPPIEPTPGAIIGD